MIGELDSEDLQKRKTQIETICRIAIFKKTKNNLSLKFIDEANIELIDEIKKNFNKNIDGILNEKNNDKYFENNVSEILIVSLKNTKKESLINYLRESSLTNREVIGWIIIKNKDAL